MMKYFVATIHLFEDAEMSSLRSMKQCLETALDELTCIYPSMIWEDVTVKQVTLDEYEKEE